MSLALNKGLNGPGLTMKTILHRMPVPLGHCIARLCDITQAGNKFALLSAYELHSKTEIQATDKTETRAAAPDTGGTPSAPCAASVQGCRVERP